jgi:hypothetical protein
MSEGTKKVLIITIAVVIVILAIVGMKIIPPSAMDKINCGNEERVIFNPEVYLLKYSGETVSLSAEAHEKIKGKLEVGDKLIQEALEKTQLLDRLLASKIIDYNAFACEDSDERIKLLKKIQNYKENYSKVLQNSQENVYTALSHNNEELRKRLEKYIENLEETEKKLIEQ